jgi:hypothetical protein
MMMKMALALAGLAALPAVASAQDTLSLWEEPREVPRLSSLQEQGGEAGEVWIAPRVRAAVSAYYRLSIPGDTQVTIDNLWYSDFFSVGNGFGLEGEVMSYVAPGWGIGGYLSGGWDRFNGDTLNFFNGDSLSVGDMDLTTVLVGAKFQQRVSRIVTWEGRMGLGWVHYSSVKWSGVDSGTPFSNEELFRSITRAVFEMGFRAGIGGRRAEFDLGLGFRYMGAAARGRDVTSAIDPDLFYTFMIELGLSLKF